MPVDADIQKVLDVLNAMPPVDYAKRPPLELARAMRSTPVTIPPIPNPAARVENRTIPGPHGDIPVRIYWPHGKGPCGVMVSLHGGGWVIGSLNSDEFKSHHLVHQAGCAIVSVDYRLSPEHRYPVPLDDCYAALEWTSKNAASLGFDANRIAIGGSSAGANLAAAVALMTRDRGGPALRFQLLTYPVCDDDFDRPSYIENATRLLLSREQMKWFWDQYVDPKDRSHPYVAPIRDTKLGSLPPALVITAEFDPLRDEGEAYAQRLKEAGVPVICQRYDGMVHGFLSAAVQHPSSMAALNLSAQQLKKYIG